MSITAAKGLSVVTAIFCILATSCSGSGSSSGSGSTIIEPASVKVQSVSLDKTSLELYEGESSKLTANVTPQNADEKSVTWTTSDKSVATVSDGLVAALKAGKCIITVRTTDGGYTANCNVQVTSKIVKVTGVSFKDSQMTINRGASVALSVVITPSDATDKTVTWTSSNPSVATVSDGTVTAAGLGETTITVKTNDGGFTASCKVTVSYSSNETIGTIPGSSWGN